MCEKENKEKLQNITSMSAANFSTPVVPSTSFENRNFQLLLEIYKGNICENTKIKLINKLKNTIKITWHKIWQ